MSGNALALAWDLIARDGASPAFDKVAVSADRAAASTERAAVSTEASAARMGGSLTKWLAPAALVAFGAEAVKLAADFQSSMLLVQTQAGASADEVRKMTPAILALAGPVAQAPEALATSLYHVESTGLRGKAALDAVTVAAEGAAVGHANLEETTNALTATIASGMLPATETYAQAMGQLNTIVGSGDMKLQDLNEALGTGLLVTVKQYGVTLNDVGAALADFGDNNIRGADAATMVRMAVQAISKPSVSAAGDLRTIGLTVEQLQSDEQTGGLNKALTDLHGHLVSSGLEANKWGGLLVDAFTKKAGAGIITLIGTYDRFEQKYKEVGEGSSKFADEFAATQKTAAFQAKALEDSVISLTTAVGGGLLPVVTDGLTWINQTGVPALEHLGSGAGNAAHWIGQLPAPIKETALVLAGLAAANAVGLTGLLAAGGAKAADGFSAAGAAVSRFGDNMAVQQALAQAEARSLSAVDVALGGLGGGLNTVAGELTNVQLMMRGWDAELAQTVVAEDVATASTGRFSASLATVGARGLAAVSSGLGSVVGMLGGPWGVAMGVGIAAFIKFQSVEQDATDQTNKWVDALKKGGPEAQAASAQMQAAMRGIDMNSWQAKFVTTKNPLVGSIEEALPFIGMFRDKMVLGAGAAADAQKAIDAYQKSLSPTEKAQQDLTNATTELDKALQSGDPRRIAIAQQDYTNAVDASNTATDRLTRAQTLLAAGAPVTAKSLALIGDISSMNTDQIKGAEKALDDEVKALQKVDAAFIDPLKTYQDMAKKVAEATAASTKSSKDSWSDYIDNVKVDLGKYAGDLEKQIKDEQNWQTNLVTIAKRGGEGVAQQFADMGVAGAGLTAQMATATGKNFDRMAKDMQTKADLGGAGAAKALQTEMAVAAAVGSAGAKATVQGIATQLGLGVDVVRGIAAQYGLKLAEGINPILYSLGKAGIHVSGGGAVGGIYAAGGTQLKWSGGYTGEGGKYEPKGIVHGGEFVFTKEQTSKAGVSRLYDLAAMLSGYSGGGFVSSSSVPAVPSLAPYRAPISTAGAAAMGAEHDAVVSWLAASLFAPGAPTSVSANAALARSMAAAIGWTGAEWDALYAVGMRESGWNNVAQNPSSTAYGIPQFLDSTWATVGMSKTSDPALQIGGMDRYIKQRYVDPIGAWAHEQKFGWYDSGGRWPTGTIGINTSGKTETVRTWEQEQANQKALAGRAAPLMHVEHLHMNDQVDVELALQQAQFREQVGVFS